jgi:hypothetical protein
VPFAHGGARITLPAGYGYELEGDGRTIVIRPARRELFEFRITYNSLAKYARERRSVAEDFIHRTAQKKGRRVHRIKGTDSIGFIEPGAASTVKDEPVRNIHGLMSLGKGYVTFTLTVPEKYAHLPEVRAFVGGGMESLLGALRAGES